jgi:hypothetical protein
MDFTSFVAMLVHRGLFFSRIDMLDDPFEGSIPRRWIESPGVQGALEAEGITHAQDIATRMRQVIEKQRAWTMVNCWHMNEEESAAMWNLYSKGDKAIAIQSTYQRLRDSLSNDVYIGTVSYISYESESIPFGNVLWPFMHKRKSFEHERELRALVCDIAKALSNTEPPTMGQWRELDLCKLIESVFIAPSAPDWFVGVLADIQSKYGLSAPVKHSSLDVEPLH